MDCIKLLYSEISFKPASTTIQSAVATKNAYNNNSSASSATTTTNGTSTNGHPPHNNSNNNNQQQPQLQHEEFRVPKHQLCDPSVIKLDWSQSEKIGGGLINVGNTCFLNSVLQCLTYCPPLCNFLLDNGGHSSTCKINQFCMLCEMEKHVKRIRNANGCAIKPVSIVQRLKYINKSFSFGRQEDAHEFLRYIIDHMWKACLMNLDINVKSSKIDPKVKETTIINHIFGGYHRSQVLCLTCNSRSNTYDFFMDFILDIRHAKSLEDALKKFTQSETLEHENAYKCGKCRKKVTAKKKFTVYKAPNVATFQLKRFDSDRIFGGKITKFISYPEELDLTPYMSHTSKSSIKYQLSSVLVHVGHSSNSGHYFCFIRNSNGLWYRMDDSSVSMVKRETVLQQLAYVLFYTRKSDQKIPSDKYMQPINNTIKISNGSSSNGTSNMNNGILASPNYIESPKPIPQNANNNTVRIFSKQQESSTPTTSPLKNQSSSEDSTTVPASPTKSSATFLAGVPSISKWFGGNKSKLAEEDPKKRKLNQMTDRDKFNEELDQGKIKKVKSHNRDERFSTLSKQNPFQRYASNGYQQHNNNVNNSNQRVNAFQKRNGQFHHSHNNNSNHNNNNNNSRRFDSHRNKFRHNGKHKNRHFNQRP